MDKKVKVFLCQGCELLPHEVASLLRGDPDNLPQAVASQRLGDPRGGR